MINGLYEEGSKQKYISSNKNLSKKYKFSEHYGFITFMENKVDKIIMLNEYRIDKADPTIFQPVNTVDALKYKYILPFSLPTFNNSLISKNGRLILFMIKS